MANVSSCAVSGSDFDCQGNLVCYGSAVSWNEEAACLCSGWYGWKGQDCDEFGLQTYWSVVVNLVIIGFALVGIVRGATALFELIKHNKDGKLLNASNKTALYATLALTFLICWRGAIIVTLVTPNLAVRQLESSPDTKFHSLTVVDRVFATLSVLFATLSALNISLMWVEVANSSARIRRRIGNNFSTYKIINYTFQGLFATAMVVMMALNQPDFATLAAFPFLLFVAVTFLVGQSKMNALLGSMAASASSSGGNNGAVVSPPSSKSPRKVAGNGASSSGDQRYLDMIRLIRKTSRRVIAAIFSALLFGGLYAYMNLSWRDFAVPGKLATVAIMNEMLILSLLLVVWSVQSYCYQNMRTTLKRLKGVTSRTEDYSKGTDSFTATNNMVPGFGPGSTSGLSTGSLHKPSLGKPSFSGRQANQFQEKAKSMFEEGRYSDDDEDSIGQYV